MLHVTYISVKSVILNVTLYVTLTLHVTLHVTRIYVICRHANVVRLIHPHIIPPKMIGEILVNKRF